MYVKFGNRMFTKRYVSIWYYLSKVKFCYILALRKMRKLDEVASIIANNSRTNSYRRSYRLPISITKLKHLMTNPNNKDRHDDVNRVEEKQMRNKYGEANFNQQGNHEYCIS